MAKDRKNLRKTIVWSASLLAASTFAFSPILFPALAQLNGNRVEAKNWLNNFTPAGLDSKLAEKFKRQLTNNNAIAPSKNRFPFTPSGVELGKSRTMTIAARTDSVLSSKAISTRNIVRLIEPGVAPQVDIRKSDFRLTASRGWQGFKLPATPRSAVKAPVSEIKLAAGEFRLDKENGAKKSRFKTDVKLDKQQQAAPSPRGNAAAGEYKVGLESSFSLSRRVDLTAGVTYNSERDRVAPRVDDRKDSEAVYVGTKIRF
jgi:hypothetical protein